MNLTETDIKVLKLVQSGQSLSRQDMAEQAGMSASTLWRRISELEQHGIIQHRTALLDPIKVGVPICVLVSVNLTDHEVKTRTRFEDFVEATPDIMECFSVTGGFDYVMIVRTRSVSDFEHFLMDKILGNKSVATASSQISLRQLKYSTEIPL